METHLTTVDEVIEALGKSGAVKRFVRARRHQVIYNWVSRGRIPSRFFSVMTQRLADLGYTAAPELWGQGSVVPTPTPRRVEKELAQSTR